MLVPLVAAVAAVADQLSKEWALHHLKDAPDHVVGPVWFILTYNSGAAFGVGTGVTPVVEAAVVVLLVWLLLVSRRAARTATGPVSVALGLILGGAVSNLADRLFRHLPGHPAAVVDFIQAVSWWPVFNVADSCIVVGVVILIVAYPRRRTDPVA